MGRGDEHEPFHRVLVFVQRVKGGERWHGVGCDLSVNGVSVAAPWSRGVLLRFCVSSKQSAHSCTEVADAVEKRVKSLLLVEVSGVGGEMLACRAEVVEEVTGWADSLDSGLVFHDRVRLQWCTRGGRTEGRGKWRGQQRGQHGAEFLGVCGEATRRERRGTRRQGEDKSGREFWEELGKHDIVSVSHAGELWL